MHFKTMPVLNPMGTRKEAEGNILNLEGTTTTTTTFFYIERFYAGVQELANSKPKRNFVHCTQCGRVKMLFPSKLKADQYISHNREQILSDGGLAPVRSYYCERCRGWHTTSRVEVEKPTKNEDTARLVREKKQARERKKKTELILKQVECYVLYTLENYRKENRDKAKRMWTTAWKLFQRTMTSEYCMNRKLFLFNQLSLCQDLLK